MGIDHLRRYLREHHPGSLSVLPVQQLRGRRVFIDTHGWTYQNACPIWTQLALQSHFDDDWELRIRHDLLVSRLFANLMSYIFKLLRFGVTPVFIFDGAHPPEKEVKYKREEKKSAKKIARMAELRTMLHKDALDGAAEAELKKLIAQRPRFPHEVFEDLYGLVDGLGLPCCLATGEGEKLVAALAIEGWGVGLSDDTDSLALGSPLTIYDIEGETAQVMYLPAVLQKLEMSFELFRDFCIAAQCDFNTRIRGLGIVTLYHALKRCGSLEQLLYTADPAIGDTEPYAYFQGCKYVQAAWRCIRKAGPKAVGELNLDGCRRLFSYQTSRSQMRAGRLVLQDAQIHIRSQLQLYGVEQLADELFALLRDLPAPPLQATSQSPYNAPHQTACV